MKLTIDWLKEFVEVRESITKVGERFYNLGFEVESIEGEVLDLEVTPNRGDVLSIIGLAREYAASTNQTVKFSSPQITTQSQSSVKTKIETDLLTDYISYSLTDLTIKDSPDWMVKRLKSVDIDPINLVVDITNYVMIELGVPLHAFDLDRIDGNEITFRESLSKESITTINGQTHQLTPGILIANDASKIIDLVGLQGGESSSITSQTKNILLQGLILDPKNIRSTSKKLKQSSQASYRLERGIDPLMVEIAVWRAVSLIAEYCGGKINFEFKKDSNRTKKVIDFDSTLVEKVTGTNISSDRTSEILKGLGFEINGHQVVVPSYRQLDVKLPIDVVEEVIRIYGYNNLIKAPLPQGESNPISSNQDWLKQTELAQRLINLGFSEIMTYSFMPQPEDTTNLVKIINPLSPENSYLRDSLIPMLVNVANLNSWYPSINLFEIGHIYSNKQESSKVALISGQKIDLPNSIMITPENYITKRKYYAWEGEIDQLLKLIPDVKAKYTIPIRPYHSISKYPPVVRDIAILINKDIPVNTIRDDLFEIEKDLLTIELFDEFESEKIGLDKKSLGLRLILDDPNKTMTTEEIDSKMANIYAFLNQKYQASIR